MRESERDRETDRQGRMRHPAAQSRSVSGVIERSRMGGGSGKYIKEERERIADGDSDAEVPLGMAFDLPDHRQTASVSQFVSSC